MSALTSVPPPATRPVVPARPRTGARPSTARQRTTQQQRAVPKLAPWTPFVVLVCGIVTTGLVVLLLLNTVLAQDAFVTSSLQTQAARLAEKEAALRQSLAKAAAPGELAKRAKKQGMVPGSESPAFLAPDGTVRGVPAAAPTPVKAEKKKKASADSTRGGESPPTRQR